MFRLVACRPALPTVGVCSFSSSVAVLGPKGSRPKTKPTQSAAVAPTPSLAGAFSPQEEEAVAAYVPITATLTDLFHARAAHDGKEFLGTVPKWVMRSPITHPFPTRRDSGARHNTTSAKPTPSLLWRCGLCTAPNPNSTIQCVRCGVSKDRNLVEEIPIEGDDAPLRSTDTVLQHADPAFADCVVTPRNEPVRLQRIMPKQDTVPPGPAGPSYSAGYQKSGGYPGQAKQSYQQRGAGHFGNGASPSGYQQRSASPSGYPKQPYQQQAGYQRGYPPPGGYQTLPPFSANPQSQFPNNSQHQRPSQFNPGRQQPTNQPWRPG